MTIEYGAFPDLIKRYTPATVGFEEYMHWMYLPVRMPHAAHIYDVMLPDTLWFLTPMLHEAIIEEDRRGNRWDYVYLTARRGYATPGNPLNRPGWHSDGFGTDDVNYVWVDRFPTEFAVGIFKNISDDHVVSAQQFEEQIADTERRDRITTITYSEPWLMRLNPTVIHAAPQIPAPGGERSFVKFSFSNDRYGLKGNSHNYRFDYDWPMLDRSAVRNDPASAAKDAS